MYLCYLLMKLLMQVCTKPSVYSAVIFCIGLKVFGQTVTATVVTQNIKDIAVIYARYIACWCRNRYGCE